MGTRALTRLEENETDSEISRRTSFQRTSKEKHAIRLQLHSQLLAYWQKDSRRKEINENLKGLQVPELKAVGLRSRGRSRGSRTFTGVIPYADTTLYRALWVAA